MLPYSNFKKLDKHFLILDLFKLYFRPICPEIETYSHAKNSCYGHDARAYSNGRPNIILQDVVIQHISSPPSSYHGDIKETDRNFEHVHGEKTNPLYPVPRDYWSNDVMKF